MRKKIQRCNILGVAVSVLTMSDAVNQISEWIDERTPHYVCLSPAHSIMECYHQPSLRKVYNQSGMTTPDGMAIVWLLKLHGYRSVERVYGPDLLQAVCKYSEMKHIRHYFVGGAPGVVEKLIERLRQNYSGIQIVGSESPPYRLLSGEEETAMINRIKTAKPDIVWVGLGSPRQEAWMAEYTKKLNIPVLIGVGAAFDFLSGTKPQAPRWMQRSGLEWLFRLMSDPRRLWRRYIQYPKFIFLVIMQSLHFTRYPLDGIDDVS